MNSSSALSPPTQVPTSHSQPAALSPARQRISRLQVVDAQDGPNGEAFFAPVGLWAADGITTDFSITASPRWQITARSRPIVCEDGSAPSLDSPGVLKSPVGAVSLLSPAARPLADVVAVVRPTKTRAPANEGREPDLSSCLGRFEIHNPLLSSYWSGGSCHRAGTGTPPIRHGWTTLLARCRILGLMGVLVVLSAASHPGFLVPNYPSANLSFEDTAEPRGGSGPVGGEAQMLWAHIADYVYRTFGLLTRARFNDKTC
ncbi:hypothetical protein B0T18DRAFT_398152 [Schizothecium vesticola]|uniref:Uncharacterized protein n=1 Tax=Schizothecium vesticola TaxID=314040 RepID=A0AA40FAA3_9PEZI|nr:hypothetical protein B0T18DRAFT_398152 [Schizothecium vesticola]